MSGAVFYGNVPQSLSQRIEIDALLASISAMLVVQVRTHCASGLLTPVFFPQRRDCPSVVPRQLCNSVVVALLQDPVVAAFEKLGNHSASLCIVEILFLWCLGNTLSARHAPSHHEKASMCHFESSELCLLLLGCCREGLDCQFWGKKSARAVAANSMQKNV